MQAFPRGQVSVEMLIVAGVLLLFIAIVSAVAFLVFWDSSAINQTNQSLRALQNAVNQVNALGPGNSVVVEITLPTAATNGFVGGPSGKDLGFLVSTIGGDQNYWVITDALVSGTLPTESGTFNILVSSTATGVSLQSLG